MTNPNVVPLQSTWDGRMLALIRKTVASDCNENEFELFIHTARHLRLDPLRRQIYAFVFNKGDADKRRMSIVTSIDGLRTIAARTGDYRPDEDEPTYEYGEPDPDSNPLGLVKATVRVWKFSHGAWHRTTGVAHWDEYAPIKQGADEYEWVDTGEIWPDTGRPKKKKRPVGDVRPMLDKSGKWGTMGRLMLAKCAEGNALRKGWPDDLSALYAEEEMDKARTIDLSAAELIETAAAEDRRARIGGPGLTIDWLDAGAALDRIPYGKFADRALAWLNENADQPGAIQIWTDRNRRALQDFWAEHPGDALELKKRTEEILAKHGVRS